MHHPLITPCRRKHPRNVNARRTLPQTSPYMRPALRSGLLVASIAGTALTGSGAASAATDRLDAQASSRVSSASGLGGGQMDAALKFQHAEFAKDQDTKLIQRRASALFGVGLSDRFDLGLGVHGLATAKGSATKGSAAEGSEAASENSVSGSLLAKYKMFSAGAFSLGLAGFGLTGSKAADHAQVGGRNPSGGLMLLSSWGSKGRAELSFNAGMRWRNPEESGDYLLRNEAFLGLGAKAWLSRSFHVFVSGTGRRVMISDLDSGDQKRVWRPTALAEGVGGIGVSAGRAQFTAFVGSGVDRGNASLGQLKTFAGLGVNWSVGRVRENAPAFVAEQESAPAESLVKDINPLEDLAPLSSEEDDFTAIEKSMRQTSADPKPSRSDIVDAELTALRDAEQKAEEQRKKAEIAERELARRDAVKRSAASEKERRKWAKEAQKEADALEGITKDELEWKGLE